MRSALVRLAGATGGWLLAGAASAALLVPTITTDELASPGEGCSLREAVLQANRNVVIDPACGEAGDAMTLDTIALAPAATYVLSLSGEDDLGEVGDLDVDDDAAVEDLTILGNGATLAAHELLGDRLLDVLSGTQVDLRSLTIRGGRVTNPLVAAGGGVRSAGRLFLAECTIRDHRVVGGSASGGGIASSGVLELTDCVLSDNEVMGGSASGGGISARDLRLVRTHVVGNRALGQPGTGAFARGGGVAAAGTDIQLIDCFLEGNRAQGGSGSTLRGGGIVFGGGVDASGLGSIQGCTFSGNIAKGGDGGTGGHAIGGGIQIGPFADFTISNSTFSGNSTLPGVGSDLDRATRESVGAIFTWIARLTLDSVTVTGSSAVGIYNSGATVTLTNSLVALQASGGDCAGSPITSADYNLDSDGSCDLSGPNDQPAVPLEAVGLRPLAHNGGFGPTHAISPSSAAFDRGETALGEDQRGVARPQFLRDDVGALEQDTFAAAEIPLLGTAGLLSLVASLALAALALLRLAHR